METVRVLADYGSPRTVSIVNTRPVVPVVLSMTTGRYPDLDEVKKAIADLSGRALFLEATEIALELGAPIVTNVVMAGALVGSGLLPVTAEALEETIRKNVPARHVELNLKAFRAGLSSMERLLAT
jgi:indolepyruvate ferredoxin oxidoreductase beta subunit